MKNGDFLKANIEYKKQKFQTKEGIFCFLVGTLVSSYIVIGYYNAIYDAMRIWLMERGIAELLATLLALWGVAFTFSIFGIAVAYVLVSIWRSFAGKIKGKR